MELTLRPDERILHPTFGPGTIRAHEGDVITVDFDRGGTKKLNHTIAELYPAPSENGGRVRAGGMNDGPDGLAADGTEAAESLNPENCGCGRPRNHRGRCAFRRKNGASPARPRVPMAPRKPRPDVSSETFLGKMEAALAYVEEQRAAIEELEASIKRVIEIYSRS